jgi:hypothetical protein
LYILPTHQDVISCSSGPHTVITHEYRQIIVITESSACYAANHGLDHITFPMAIYILK